MQGDSPSEIYIGLMSGTSLDGVDIAIIDFAQHPPTLIHSATFPYQQSLAQQIREITVSGTADLDSLCRLDVELGNTYAQIINQSLEETNLNVTQIRAIGNHGQTIRHSPATDLPYTLQIGDPNIIAAKTGITTVADFRRQDIALGGQGAPLAPAFHQYLFRSNSSNRAIINIGGIANITYLPSHPDSDVIGFDTGPGNTLSDYWINRHKGVARDENGDWAATGNIISDLLDTLLRDESYFQQPLPKTTGTEHFNANWLLPQLQPNLANEDVQATLIELTAITIARGIEQLPSTPAECFLCGGGVHNSYLIERLQRALPDYQILSTSHLGLDPDYVEAAAFAWLARQNMNRQAGNLLSVTQAKSQAVLGGVYFQQPANR
jgi:anhydro-N-acetylmuramic acid kinase